MFRKKRDAMEAVIKGQSDILEIVKAQQKSIDILIKNLTDLQKVCFQLVCYVELMYNPFST